MTDLSDLAEEVSKDLPWQVRKIIDAANASGWELNSPGMTLCLRLNHPTDDLADPVYVTWIVGRSPTGKMSFRFMSCGTRGLVPLKGADLLVYLEDPTVAYLTSDDVEDIDAALKEKALEDTPPWDTNADLMVNLNRQLGASIVEVERTRKPRAPRKTSVSRAPLRVQAPRA